MNKSKMSLKDLKVNSFVTAAEQVRGGSEVTHDPMGCRLSLMACSNDVMCSDTSDAIQ